LVVIGMVDLLTPVRVVPQLRATDRDDLMRTLAQHLAADSGVSEEALVAAVMATKDLPPLMLRGGVSLLHTFVEGLARPIAVFARLRHPMDFGVAGCATDIVALLASPAAKTGDHLRALACMARRLRRSDVLAHVRATKCRELMYLALTSDEWCVPGADSPSSTRGLSKVCGYRI